MIRNIFVTLLVSLLSLHPVFSKDFRVNVNYLVFHIPDETSYLELQFKVRSLIRNMKDQVIHVYTEIFRKNRMQT